VNSHQEHTIQEINKLVQEDSIETEAALRLTLASQLIINESLKEIQALTHRIEERAGKRMDELEEGLEARIDDLEEDVKDLRGCVNKKVGSLEEHLEKYPSIVWFWIHRRRTLILLILASMVMYTILFGWVNISDIRQAVLHQLGLPPDLGLGPIPTPIP
jgi:ATP/maltotriose-dependent transcriptional regulator MalT